MATDRIEQHIEPEERRQLTLMFYFASDNPLAPSIVSQLKALKGAGFHAEANVIAHFDPYTRDTPSHVFEVNVVEKHKLPPGESFVGFDADDPFVRKLVLDKVWEEGDGNGNSDGAHVRKLIEELLRNRKSRAEGDRRNLPVLPNGVFGGERSPKESLETFLEFCRKKYPADRYMLFILGHGVVVGNDVFLFDSNPGGDPDDEEDEVTPTAPTGNGDGTPKVPVAAQGNGSKPSRRNSLTLLQLGKLLRQFNSDIGDSKFELVSFHSCSMSGAEVVYELQDTAHYMIASQGPAFVGSWPYRQILLRLFKCLGAAAAPRTPGDAGIREAVRDIFSYVVHNSYDFQLAGYSFDVALCDLTKAGDLKQPVSDLARALTAGLAGKADLPDEDDAGAAAAVPLARELMLLAHWDAQSFWQENYTDLYDFCSRLLRRCELVQGALSEPSAVLGDIGDACRAVTAALEKGSAGDDDRLVMRSEFVGAEYQYSHGLSIFFPWAKPADLFFDRKYIKYRFAVDTGWRNFLDEYFVKTRRATRKAEDEAARRDPAKAPRPRSLGVDEIEKKALELMQVIGDRVFTATGELAKNGIDDRTGPPGKVGSDDPTGGADCGCPTFKNHPAFTGDDKPRQEISQSIGGGATSMTAI